MNFQMFKLDLEKAEEPEIASIPWIIEKAEEFQKNIYFCFIDYAKAFVWITTIRGKFWKRWEYQTTWPPSWETCMQVRKQVRTGHGTTDWFKIRKGVCQDCILSPCLFNLNAEDNMQNDGLDKAQPGIKIARRNISNLRYADDTTLMSESQELKSLLKKVKEESEKAGLKLSIQKTKIMTSCTITSRQIEGENVEEVTDFIFLASKNHCG